MSEEAFIYVRERRLPYMTFDADNHLYENKDAFTKFLPAEYKGAIRYIDVDGKTKLALREKISHYIPNPTFERVAVPGGFGNDVTRGGKGFGDSAGAANRKVRAMPGMDAFFDPEPRMTLMKDMGIDRTLLWPTLASVLEARCADDPDFVVTVVHALNEWMHEHWSYVYSDAIYSTPIISLAAGVGPALKELEYILERGAKIFLLRVAPVPTWKGPRSFALPEFDEFWQAVQDADITVGQHSGDPDYARFNNEWQGITGEMLPFKVLGSPAFLKLASEKSPVEDGVASIIGHGLATRFPKLRFMPVEYACDKWVRPFVEKMQRAYEASPVLFDEDPFEVFKRNIYIHTFHEPDPKGLLDLGIPADRLMFGSDFPHPEGMSDPLAYSEVIENLDLETQALIMGGTIAKALKVGDYANS
ncbi:MAG: amidohydrolase family protein [Acidimicrobiia bacterium]